ncbi:hypothetical protein [Fundidesulfovibrio terrae]|uniref:hypothetical protein n=1 Tax=Fundidesulfovibrio terrae TaxID=2922866 RepID=UPI001FB00685|nr:hypothetical protein [Fundidesulfovibrio terrae]
MHKLINSEILKIQREYLQLLQGLIVNVHRSKIASAIDNVLVFWHSHRRVTSLFLNCLDQSSRAYLFTGASYLNTKDNNHYPFVLLGDIHIVDDPLCKFAKIFPRIVTKQQQNLHFDYIVNATNDIIDIIQRYNQYILVLPVTFGFHEENHEINEVSTKNFLYLFKEEFSSIKEYATKLVKIEDIFDALKDECKNIPISDATSTGCGLIEEFNELKTNSLISGLASSSDSFLFYTYVHGMLTQSLDIILCCLRFGIVPYIRSRTCFYYAASAAGNFLKISEIRNMHFHMTCAYILYKTFPEGFERIGFEEYCKAARDFDIDSRFSALLLKHLETSQLSFREIKAELKVCFGQLAESLKVSLD